MILWTGMMSKVRSDWSMDDVDDDDVRYLPSVLAMIDYWMVPSYCHARSASHERVRDSLWRMKHARMRMQFGLLKGMELRRMIGYGSMISLYSL